MGRKIIKHIVNVEKLLYIFINLCNYNIVIGVIKMEAKDSAKNKEQDPSEDELEESIYYELTGRPCHKCPLRILCKM